MQDRYHRNSSKMEVLFEGDINFGLVGLPLFHHILFTYLFIFCVHVCKGVSSRVHYK